MQTQNYSSKLCCMSSILAKFSRWYFSRKALPYWGILFIDTLIVLLSSFFVHVLNTGVMNTLENLGPLLGTYVVYGVFYLIGFRVFRTYSGVIRYSSFVDLQRVALATLLGTLLILLFRMIEPLHAHLVYIRIRDLIYTFLLSTLWMWSIRVMVKYIYDMT